MARLIVTRGLPASGKTTFANKWVDEDHLNRVRVNRDDIRSMAFHGFYSSTKTEPLTIAFRDRMIKEALAKDFSVINDDTNLPQRTVKQLAMLAHNAGADFQVVDFTDVTPQVCEERNAMRIARGEKGVSAKVIWDMWGRYLKGKDYPLPLPEDEKPANLYVPYVPDITLPDAVIFDIDGTVAHSNGRSPYDYTKVGTDLPDNTVINTVDLYHAAGFHIIFLSGRKWECYDATDSWLMDNTQIFDFTLLMRADGDDRRDSIVKYELFDKNVRPYYNVHGVYDDRNQVVEMWREIGLKCYQVAEGNF